MNRTLEDLAAAFGECHLTTPTGRLFKPAVPIDLAHALGARVATRLVRDRLHPIIDLALRTPQLASEVTVGLLPIGNRAGFLCVRTADAPPMVVAAVVAERMATLVSLFFVDFLGSSGEAYGVCRLEQPPVFIANRRPDLLRRAFVMEAFAAWMRWADCHGLEPWSALRREVAERWGRDEWGDLGGAELRRSLLRVYLTITYVERPAQIRCGSAPGAVVPASS
jgi:hypothetical protein